MTQKSERLARNVLDCYQPKLQGNALLEQIKTEETTFSLYCNTSGGNRSYFVELDDGNTVLVDPIDLAKALSSPFTLIPSLLECAGLADKAAASREGSRHYGLPDVWCNLQTEHGAITLTGDDPPFRFRLSIQIRKQGEKPIKWSVKLDEALVVQSLSSGELPLFHAMVAHPEAMQLITENDPALSAANFRDELRDLTADNHHKSTEIRKVPKGL